jgi:heme-degrading monooxygenase HmoA
MPTYANDTIAVIFVNQRTGTDEAGYQAAAAAMDALAKEQSGYRGIDSVRNADGAGITVSYWDDEDAAKAWRDNADHTAIREAGRDRWYASYSLHVAAITRSYDWAKRP